MTMTTPLERPETLENVIDAIIEKVELDEDNHVQLTDLVALRDLAENAVHLPFGLTIRGRFSAGIAEIVERLVETVHVHTALRVVMTPVPAPVEPSPRRQPEAADPPEDSSAQRPRRRPSLRLQLHAVFDRFYDDLLAIIGPSLRRTLMSTDTILKLDARWAGSGDRVEPATLPTMLALGLYAPRDEECPVTRLALAPRAHFVALLATGVEACVAELWKDIETKLREALAEPGRDPQLSALAPQIMNDRRMSDGRSWLTRAMFVMLQEYAAARLALARQRWNSWRATQPPQGTIQTDDFLAALSRDIHALIGIRERQAHDDPEEAHHGRAMDGLLQASASYLRRVVRLPYEQVKDLEELGIRTVTQLHERAPAQLTESVLATLRVFLIGLPRAQVDELARSVAAADLDSPRAPRDGAKFGWNSGCEPGEAARSRVGGLGLGRLHQLVVGHPRCQHENIRAVLEDAALWPSKVSERERKLYDRAAPDAACPLPVTATALGTDVLKALSGQSEDETAQPLRQWVEQWWQTERELWRRAGAKEPTAKERSNTTDADAVNEAAVEADRFDAIHPYLPQPGAAPPRPPRTPPTTRVLVIGGGIAGLTAAHELADRGFGVHVIEKLQGPGQDGRPEPNLGGIAASQWSRPPAASDNPREQDEKLTPAWSARRTEPRYLHDSVATLRFKRDSDEFEDPVDAVAKLIALGRKYGQRGHEVMISGHTAGRNEGTDFGQDTEGQEWPLARRRAEKVGKLLIVLARFARENPTATLPTRFTIHDLGDTQSVSYHPSDAANQRVEIRQREDILPGEHGYRFFPSFYRHVFDTMRRIPIYDRDGNETERTVFDNLTPTRTQVFSGTHYDVDLAREKPRGLEGFRRGLQRMLGDFGFDRGDVTRFTARMLRYMISSKQRRADYEDLSWMDYVTLHRPHAQTPSAGPRIPYSDAFIAQLRAAPQALVAMDADTCDARTQGNIVVQLMLDQLLDRGGPTDCTLNGPTTTAWFAPWKRHLQTLGVTFEVAELKSLVYDTKSRSVRPILEPDRAKERAEFDYIVLATDVLAAEQVTQSLRLGSESVPAGLRGFTRTVHEPAGERGQTRAHARPSTRVVDERSNIEFEWPVFGLGPFDRLQVFSGVQFYFREDLELARGHVYYNDTEWGLSSISQTQFWTAKQALRQQDIRGIMSVDIGNFLKPSRYLGREAAQCPEGWLAWEVWRQLSESLRRARDRRRLPDSTLLPIPEPCFYHVDDHLLFSRYRDACTTLTPFLTNNVSDWKHRPGAEPWDPTSAKDRIERSDEPDIWQAGHGGYQVHFEKLVFAGTYVRTFTRMTTMEAANESARHAVNAILDHMTARREHFMRTSYMRAVDDEREQAVDRLQSKDDPALSRAARAQARATVKIDPDTLIGRFRKIDARPVRISGDYCKIFDPEQHELEELAFLKRVDVLLAREDMPHMFDILGVEGWLDQLHPDADPLEGLFAALSDTVRDDWAIKTSEVLAALAPGKKLGDMLRERPGKDAAARLAELNRQIPGWIDRIVDRLKRRP